MDVKCHKPTLWTMTEEQAFISEDMGHIQELYLHLFSEILYLCVCVCVCVCLCNTQE